MSILWGILKESGAIVSESEVADLSSVTEPYATGNAIVSTFDRLGVGFQLYASHERSALETGARKDSYRNLLVWDGRLDNYRELALALGLEAHASSDSQIVLAAFRRWGADAFSRLTGDWALALWSAIERTVYLARDHAGTRTLFVHLGRNETRWATYLETLLAGDQDLALSAPYIGSYIAGTQLGNLSPYRNIYAIPPGHYLAISETSSIFKSHWSASQIAERRCASDAEYEDHFLTLLKQAVNRRLSPPESTLAELSGGMDSTAIVCVSDLLRRAQGEDAPLLDTVSYLDDAELSLDEKRYIVATENARAKVGIHLDMSFSHRTFLPHDSSRGIYLTPGADSCTISREEQFQDRVWSKGYRSLLSGIGGDELLGGVPDPMPELAGLLGSAKLRRFLRQSFAWSLTDRSPLLQTASFSFRYVAQLYRRMPVMPNLPNWLTAELRRGVQEASEEHAKSNHWKHTVQQLTNDRTWLAVMETLPHLFPRVVARPEYRYPYLDKDLVSFLMAIPREQLLRPNRRRSLMRRALKGIVPRDVIERSAKAFQLRGALQAIREARTRLEDLFQDSRLADEKCIVPDLFLSALRRTCEGNVSELRTVLRTIAMELWLQAREGAPTRSTEILDVSLTAR